MALKRLVIDGYGQVELNNCAFRRDGRIEAQCKPDAADFATVPVENGMLLAVDRVKHVVRFPEAEDALVGLVYTSEHMYDERKPGLKNFKVDAKDDMLPRVGFLSLGDKFTTNCISYDSVSDSGWTSEQKFIAALDSYAGTPLYGGIGADGSIKVSATIPAKGIKLLVINGKATMPDGSKAVQFQAIGC